MRKSIKKIKKQIKRARIYEFFSVFNFIETCLIYCSLIIFDYLYTIPACLKLEYVTAIPIPRIPNAKNPGTMLTTAAPQDAAE